MKIPEAILQCLSEPVCVAQLLESHLLETNRPMSVLDAVAVHGLSHGMYESGNLLWHAASLLHSGRTRYLAVMGGDGSPTGENAPGKSWIGSEALAKALEDKGVRAKDIIVMEPITHTKEEAYAIIRMAKERDFNRVGSVSVAYHGLRILHCVVAVMKELQYFIEWRMMFPPQTDWLMKMGAAQGQGMTNSLIAALDDAKKVQKYVDNKFGASYADVLHYLCNRDKIVRTQKWE